MICMFTDGGCRNFKDYVGAYCSIVVDTQLEDMLLTERHGELICGVKARIQPATNNITELMAVLEGLKQYQQHTSLDKLEYVVTDSRYVQMGLNTWATRWEENNWCGTNGPVKNLNLWKQVLPLWKLQKEAGCKIVHIRGHTGCFWNEICDQQCTELMKG